MESETAKIEETKPAIELKLGGRYLAKDKSFTGEFEFEVVEIAPSGKHCRVASESRTMWCELTKYEIIEELPARKEAEKKPAAVSVSSETFEKNFFESAKSAKNKGVFNQYCYNFFKYKASQVEVILRDANLLDQGTNEACALVVLDYWHKHRNR
jgi:hypothetical protein